MTFAAFFDDAALFPPGNAPMHRAVAEHVRRRGHSDRRYAGPFICPADDLTALIAALDGQEIELSLRGLPTGPVPDHVTLVAVEVDDVTERPDLPDHVAVFTERPWGGSYTVPPGTILKLRCGGAYVPSVDELADAITHCVHHQQRFKLTAGLHHALRSDEGHGFVNIMAAVVAAQDGKDPAPVLAASDVSAIGIDTDRLSRSRDLFLSIGTCSIDEPLADLRHLGLIS
ncbi:hypothetical protein [Aeromicrobium fastidiosum]|uniref:Uncharacterized protein n=1 Tax=Aeromicrobium fastidiosum TaxID=52699 RepID=A0A641AHA5_9ACTN|nr:hypothetical protein [Aeromicrobium fastidiosum]KAA1373067.1 hypothetical protein ESP62_018465 [Aeromicrobium fastidiosum]MBP2391051.1 hypothetical protein [Aeromicrobium fastidiosum]